MWFFMVETPRDAHVAFSMFEERFQTRSIIHEFF